MNLFFLVSLFFFSGCGVYRSNIDCPIGEGVNCVPVSEIIKMIDDSNASDDPLEDVVYEFKPPKGKCDARSH